MTRRLSGYCDCGDEHEATYSHEGRFGEGPIFEVVCPKDNLSIFLTTEGLTTASQRALASA